MLLQRTAKIIRPLLHYLPFITISGYAVCCLFLWVEDGWRPEWDSAIYILTGRSLAEGKGYTYLGQPFFLRPPGLPWLISLILQDGSLNAHILNLLVMFFAAATIVAIYFALKINYGRWIALGVSLLTCTSPLLVSRFNWVQSEFPFMSLLFLGIGLLEFSRAQTKWWIATSLLAGTCLAGAIYFRTVAVLVVPCIFLTDWISKRKTWSWRVWIPTLIAILLALPWLQYAQKSSATVEVPSEQLLLFDYMTGMFHVDPGNPTSDLVALKGWLTRVSNNGRALLHDLGLSILWLDNVLCIWILAAITITGWVRILRSHPSILEFFAVFYTIVLLTYFAYDMRLVMPLVPLVYLYLYTTISALSSWLSRRFNIGNPIRSLNGLTVCTLLILNLMRFPQELDAPQITLTGKQSSSLWNDMYSAAAWIRNHTPADAVILCNQAPVIALLADRQVYTYRFPRRRNLLERYNPDFVLFEFRSLGTLKLEQFVAGRSTRRWVLPSSLPQRKITIYEVNKP